MTLLLLIRPYRPQDQAAVIELWRTCGLVVVSNDPAQDIVRKLQVDPELFLVGGLGEEIVATVMAGYEGHRGWVNYLAVVPDRRRSGLGRQMMAEAEQRLLARGCPKINLQIRHTNIEVRKFYERIGYTEDPVVSMGKRLITDRHQT